MIGSSPLRLAVFDCDGTLVDSEKSIVECMGRAFAAHGRATPSADAVRRMVGLPLIDAVARLAPDGESGEHERLRDGYKDAFTALRLADAVHEPLYDGILDSLAAFEGAGYLLGVATGKAHKGLLNTLKTHDLQARFVTLQTADKAPGKPNPDMLYNAMAETGAAREDTVMVGDTSYDMEMAVNAGTLAVGVAWGYHDRRDLVKAGAHVVVENSVDLFATIEDILNA